MWGSIDMISRIWHIKIDFYWLRIGVSVTFYHWTNCFRKSRKRPNHQLLVWFIKCIDDNVYCRVLLSFKALCKYWQNACWNGISNLNLQQEKEYLEQCVHLLAPTKNKVVKHFINTGKFGRRIWMNHYKMLYLIRTTTQETKLDKHLKSIWTTLSVQVMAPNFVSHTNASAKMIKKYQKLIFLKIYSKRKIMSVFEKLDTKNYTTASEGR